MIFSHLEQEMARHVKCSAVLLQIFEFKQSFKLIYVVNIAGHLFPIKLLQLPVSGLEKPSLEAQVHDSILCMPIAEMMHMTTMRLKSL